MTQIVARVSSRMFGGAQLSRNKKWIDASIAFALDGFQGAQKIKRYPEFLKPIAKYFVPEIMAIHEHYRMAEEAAIPLLEARERSGEKALDLLSWMAEQAKGDEKDNKFLASILLKVSFAAIHTSAAAPSQLIYDLCAMPEYIKPLRDEISCVLEEDGLIGKKGFLHMPKMDSIMKESQRFHPLLLSKYQLRQQAII
jgi:cytochrome P450